MQLTQKDTIKLIEEFRNRRCLWDPTSADFNNRAIKRNNYAELATLFDVGYKDVEGKLHNLRSQFYREHKKVETSKLTGRDDTFVPRWYGYDLLLFLIGVEKPDSNLAKIKVCYSIKTMNFVT